ncbi:MAG: hypothetical protein ACJA2Q_002447 [Pseudohongiellaceae bacterium]|jgi:hypothetical protein
MPERGCVLVETLRQRACKEAKRLVLLLSLSY